MTDSFDNKEMALTTQLASRRMEIRTQGYPQAADIGHTYILIFRIFLPSFVQPYEIDGQADTKPPRRSDTATYRHTDAHA